MKLSTFIKQVKADYLVACVPHGQYLCVQASNTECALSKIHPKQCSHYVRLFARTKNLISARIARNNTVAVYLNDMNMPSDLDDCHRFRIQILDELIYDLVRSGE